MFKFLRALFRMLLIIVFGLRVEGQENIPSSGGAIVASNHVSFIDPIAVVVGIKRPIHFMAKDELFHNPVLAQIVRWANAFPVRRGVADRKAIRRSLELVGQGRVLGIFPEGTRKKQGLDLPLQGGAAFIACKADVPVVPVVVMGTERLRIRNPICLRIGKPLYFAPHGRASKAQIADASAIISRQFSELLKKGSVAK